MDNSINYEFLDHLIFGYFQERAYRFSGFALKNETNLDVKKNFGVVQGQLVDLIFKGQLYSQLENEILNEFTDELKSTNTGEGFSLKEYIDSEIHKKMAANYIERDQKQTESELKTTKIDNLFEYRIHIYDHFAVVEVVGEIYIFHICLETLAKKQIELPIKSKSQFANCKYFFDKLLVLSDSSQIIFVDYLNECKLLNFYKINPESEIKKVISQNEFLIVNFSNPTSTVIFKQNGDFVYCFNDHYVVECKESFVFAFSRSKKQLFSNDIATFQKQINFQHEGYEIINFEVDLNRNLMITSGSFEHSKKSVVGFWNLGTGELLFTFKTKVQFDNISICGDIILYFKNTILILSLENEKVIYTQSFDCAIKSVEKLNEGQYLIEFYGNQFKKVNAENEMVRSIAKSNANSSLYFCKSMNKILEFESIETFRMIDL